MGNICSSSKNEPEAFSQPGRVLGSNAGATSAAPRASVPAKANWNSPGRTLGGGAGTQQQQSRESGPGNQNARANAALAAQKRAEVKGAANKGKLGSQLAAQKAQTQTQTLAQVSRDERAARDVEDASAARRWN